MKTMLLLLVALVLSAQTVDTSLGIPREYFTTVADGCGQEMHHLNGHWWEHASRMERQTYLMAWYDATGDNIPASTVLYAEPSALNLPVEEAIHRFAPKSLHCENELLKR